MTSMMTTDVSITGLHYPRAVDLTQSLQNLDDFTATAGVPAALPVILGKDMRFTWNLFASQQLADIGTSSWIFPVIVG